MTFALTWGHIFIALAALVGLNALYQASIWRRHAGHGRGTPGYARARDGRRYAVWSLVLALILVAAGGLTGLRDAPLF
jgi:hypothetical protein